MRITTPKFLSSSRLKELKTLTYRDGQMWGDFLNYRERNLEHHIFVAIHEGKPIGWLVAFCEDDRYYIHLFVSPRFRRKGVGSNLVKKARSVLSAPLIGTYWSFTSEKFFRKNLVPNPI